MAGTTQKGSSKTGAQRAIDNEVDTLQQRSTDLNKQLSDLIAARQALPGEPGFADKRVDLTDRIDRTREMLIATDTRISKLKKDNQNIDNTLRDDNTSSFVPNGVSHNDSAGAGQTEFPSGETGGLTNDEISKINRGASIAGGYLVPNGGKSETRTPITTGDGEESTLDDVDNDIETGGVPNYDSTGIADRDPTSPDEQSLKDRQKELEETLEQEDLTEAELDSARSELEDLDQQLKQQEESTAPRPKEDGGNREGNKTEVETPDGPRVKTPQAFSASTTVEDRPEIKEGTNQVKCKEGSLCAAVTHIAWIPDPPQDFYEELPTPPDNTPNWKRIRRRIQKVSTGIPYTTLKTCSKLRTNQPFCIAFRQHQTEEAWEEYALGPGIPYVQGHPDLQHFIPIDENIKDAVTLIFWGGGTGTTAGTRVPPVPAHGHETIVVDNTSSDPDSGEMCLVIPHGSKEMSLWNKRSGEWKFVDTHVIPNRKGLGTQDGYFYCTIYPIGNILAVSDGIVYDDLAEEPGAMAKFQFTDPLKILGSPIVVGTWLGQSEIGMLQVDHVPRGTMFSGLDSSGKPQREIPIEAKQGDGILRVLYETKTRIDRDPGTEGTLKCEDYLTGCRIRYKLIEAEGSPDKFGYEVELIASCVGLQEEKEEVEPTGHDGGENIIFTG